MTTQYIPAGLWDSLQDVCFRHDTRFVQDVSRILGIPALEIKRKVLGTRGVPTVVPEAAGPWWMDGACPMMERVGYLWRRCGHPQEAHGACWLHKDGGTRFDDEKVQGLVERRPFRYEGQIYWVADDQSVLNSFGMPVGDFTVDLKTATLSMANDTQSSAEKAKDVDE